MIDNPVSFLMGNDFFQKNIQNFNTEIIVIDKNNSHKDKIIGLIKNRLYPYLYDNIKISYMNTDNIDFNIKNKIICVPIAFNEVEINN